jgi:hypothetical protein
MAELTEACKAMREARALASPASAETSPKPPNTQSSGNPASTEAKSSSEAEQLKTDAPNAKPESEAEAAEIGTKEAPVKAGSQILINIDKSRQGVRGRVKPLVATEIEGGGVDNLRTETTENTLTNETIPSTWKVEALDGGFKVVDSNGQTHVDLRAVTLVPSAPGRGI